MVMTELWLGRPGLFLMILCGFQSCQHYPKYFPSISLKQQENMALYTAKGNLIEATLDKVNGDKQSHRNRKYHL